MPKYELVAGDGGTILEISITDSETLVPVDLTGKTAEVRYTFNGAPVVVKSLSILDQIANKGKATYQFLSTDITVGGTITGEVRLQAGQSDQLTTVDTFHLAVKEPLA